MKHIKTQSGFEADIDETALNDMEFVDLIASIDEGSTNGTIGLSRICQRILGADKKALYDHLRDENGRVKPAEVEAELSEIMQLLGDETKN